MTELTDCADEAPGLPSSFAVAVGDPVTWADRVAQRRTSVLKLFAIGIILVVWRGREWQSRLIDKTATLDTLAIVENSGVRQIFPVEL
jgi:hypothetical protein